MAASRHRRLARTGGHPPRRAPVSKCAPCYRSPAPRVNARFCRSETDTELPNLAHVLGLAAELPSGVQIGQFCRVAVSGRTATGGRALPASGPPRARAHRGCFWASQGRLLASPPGAAGVEVGDDRGLPAGRYEP